MVGKRIKGLREDVDQRKLYDLSEAVGLVKKKSSAKFDETIEIAMNLGVDPRHADQMVRGVCQLPNGSGRTVRVAVFARGAKAEEAKKAGADVVGAEELAAEVESGSPRRSRGGALRREGEEMAVVVGIVGTFLGAPSGSMSTSLGRRGWSWRWSQRWNV